MIRPLHYPADKPQKCAAVASALERHSFSLLPTAKFVIVRHPIDLPNRKG